MNTECFVPMEPSQILFSKCDLIFIRFKIFDQSRMKGKTTFRAVSRFGVTCAFGAERITFYRPTRSVSDQGDGANVLRTFEFPSAGSVLSCDGSLYWKPVRQKPEVRYRTETMNMNMNTIQYCTV